MKKKFNFNDIVKVLDELYNSVEKDGVNNDNFEEIWKRFVNSFDNNDGDFKKIGDEYDSPLIQTLYQKLKKFYSEDSKLIKEKIDKLFNLNDNE